MKTKSDRRKGGLAVFAVAFGLLALPALGGYICQQRTAGICDRVQTVAEKAVEEAVNGDIPAAEELCAGLETLWEKERLYMGVLYDHETANRIGESISRMGVFIRTGATEALLAEAKVFACQTEALKNADRVTPANLF